MSYLSNPASDLDYGVVKIGNNIPVLDGVISLEQAVGLGADVTFGNVTSFGGVYSFGNLTITSIIPTSGAGIALSNVVTTGSDAAFTVENTGVLSLVAGPGISLTGSTGNITVSATGADLIAVYGTTTNYTATAADEYIGVNSAAAVTITLPAGTDGRVYTVKDEYGQGSGKITIQPTGGEKIDGKNTYVISVPNQSASAVFRAGNWWLI